MSDERVEHIAPLKPEDPVALHVAEDGAGAPGLDPLEPHGAAVGHIPTAMRVEEVKRLALRGVAALAMRTFGLRFITFGGNVLLARLLAPKTFGLFAIVNFIVAIASFLADLGMGAALVQRKEELTEEDLRTAFTLGLFIDVVFTAGLIIVAPLLVGLYHLDQSYALAVQALSITILLSTFASIPSIRLERTLQFGRATISDIVSQTTYMGIAVWLALSGLEVWAFVIAAVISRALDTAILNALAPWRPRLGLTRTSLRKLLVFGLPYQATGFILLVKDSFVTTFIAAALGATAVGYINWSIGLAATPLFFVTIVSRVTFPTYARLQHDPRALRTAVEQSIKWVSATVFPGVFMLMALAPQITQHVYTSKWRPGLPAFYLLCIPILASSYSTVIVSALYGLGRAKQVLKLTVIWTIAGWGLAVPLTLWLGFTGFAAAMAIVSTLSYLSVREIKKVTDIRFARTSIRILAIAGMPALAVYVLAPHVVHDLVTLAGLGFAGGIGYLLLMLWTGEVREVRRLLKVVLQRA